MKFNRRIDFFKFYKIVTFELDGIKISEFDEIINFLAKMLKICSCRIQINAVNSSIIKNEIFDGSIDKYEIFSIFINLSKNSVIFNFENCNRKEIINQNSGICIDLSSRLIFQTDKNVELLKVSIYNK